MASGMSYTDDFRHADSDDDEYGEGTDVNSSGAGIDHHGMSKDTGQPSSAAQGNMQSRSSSMGGPHGSMQSQPSGMAGQPSSIRCPQVSMAGQHLQRSMQSPMNTQQPYRMSLPSSEPICTESYAQHPPGGKYTTPEKPSDAYYQPVTSGIQPAGVSTPPVFSPMPVPDFQARGALYMSGGQNVGASPQASYQGYPEAQPLPPSATAMSNGQFRDSSPQPPMNTQQPYRMTPPSSVPTCTVPYAQQPPGGKYIMPEKPSDAYYQPVTSGIQQAGFSTPPGFQNVQALGPPDIPGGQYGGAPPQACNQWYQGAQQFPQTYNQRYPQTQQPCSGEPEMSHAQFDGASPQPYNQGYPQTRLPQPGDPGISDAQFEGASPPPYNQWHPQTQLSPALSMQPSGMQQPQEKKMDPDQMESPILTKSSGDRKIQLDQMDKDDGENKDVKLPVYERWKDMKLRIRYNEKEEIVTSELHPSILQFVLTSKKERRLLLFGLQDKLSLDCSDFEPGIVNVTLQTYMSKNDVKDALSKALRDKEFRHLNFESQQIFHSFLSSLGDLLKDGSVGVLFSSTDKKVSVDFVGSGPVVEAIEKQFKRNLENCMQEHQDHCDQSIDVYFDTARHVYANRQEVGIDTVQYLHWMNFKEHLSKHCPNSRYADLASDNSILEISARERIDVEKACSVLKEFMSDVVKKEIDFPKLELEFLEGEAVLMHLQIKLKSVGSHLLITDHAVLWSNDNKIAEAEEIIRRSYSITSAENNSGETEELRSALKEGKNKIKISYGQDRDCQILYVKNMEKLALRIKSILETEPSRTYFEHSVEFDDYIIKYAMSSDIQNEVQTAFPQVKISFCTQNNHVKLVGEEEQDLRDALKEFKACIQNIKKVEIEGISKGIEELLVRTHVSEYVARLLSLKYLLFIKVWNGITCVGPNVDRKMKLKENLENKCFGKSIVRNAFLETDYGKKFVDEHSDNLCVVEITPGKESELWYIKDKESVVLDFVEYSKQNVNFEKKGTKVVIDFLKTHGQAIVKEVENMHMVKVFFENGNLVFKGKYKDGEQAMRDLQKRVPTGYLYFEHGEKHKDLLNSEGAKKYLDDIAGRKHCCWSMTCQADDNSEELKNITKNGLSHVASWILFEGESTVSIVEADFRSTDFDVVVVPVDDKLCGENIFERGGSFEDYNRCFNMDRTYSMSLGQCKWFISREESGPKNFVFICCHQTSTSGVKQTVESITEVELQKALGMIYSNAFKNKMKSIGFAIPCDGDDTYVKNVVLGYLRGKQQHIYLCIKGEARSVVEDVNDTLSGIKGTRRIVSGKAEGIFQRPTTSIEVTEKSFFDIGAQCLVVAVAKDLDLSQGYLSNWVNKEAGGELQKKLKGHGILSPGQIVATESAGKLAKGGVKILIFGYLRKWKKQADRLKVLQQFVTDCLTKADSRNCKSIAFPALGTGSLLYPKRDVAKFMLDGIEKYIAESVTCGLDTVFISAPVFEKDDTMFQLLDLEQRSRLEEQNADNWSLANNTVDDAVLVARGSRIPYTVVKERYLQRKSLGEYVHVYILPTGKVENEDTQKYPDNWQLTIPCENSKSGIKQAVKKMVEECEKRFITSVYVHCSGFTVSCYDQAECIIQTVYDWSGNYMYLSNVAIVTDDETSFKNIEDQLLIQQKSTSRSSISYLRGGQHPNPIQWQKETRMKQTCSIRLKLIGASTDGVEAAKKEFETYLHSAVAGDKTLIQKKHCDEVSAEVNPGIVKYLDSRHEFSVTWKDCVQQVFDVQINEQKSSDVDQMKITGSFECILKMEEYLEKQFPELPELPQISQSKDLMFDEDHFKARLDQVTVRLPIHLNEKSILMEMFAEELQSLTREGVISELFSSSGSVYVRCSRDKEAHVKSKFYFFKKKLEETIDRKVHLKSAIELASAKRTCMEQSPKYTIFEVFEEEKAIRIKGTDQKAVDDLVNAIHREIKEACITAFDFYSVHAYIYKCDILKTGVECIVSANSKGLVNSQGVSKFIANAAGPQYKKECSDSVKKHGELKVSECRVTGPGILNFKKIINVNCKLESGQKHQEQLGYIKSSITNCLEEADKLGFRSVGVPFICSGAAGCEVQQCAQQYIRALTDCSPNLKHLQEVHFVDKVESNVEEGGKIFSKYFQNIGQVLAMQTISLNDRVEVHVHLCPAKMEFKSVDSEGIVVLMDKHSKEENSTIKDLLTFDDGRKFEHMLRAGNVSSQNVVTVLPFTGKLKAKYVVLVQPWLSGASKMFERDTRIMIKEILKAANKNRIVSLALPIPGTKKGQHVTRLSYSAIADEILDITAQVGTCLSDISLYSMEDGVLQQINDIINEKVKERNKESRYASVMLKIVTCLT